MRLVVYYLLLVIAGCERKPLEKGIDLDILPAKNPQLSLVHSNVRIRVTPATEAAGVAGRIGNVAGFTTPSMTGVEVIGEVKDDLAFSVMFESPQVQLGLHRNSLSSLIMLPVWKFSSVKRRADGGWDKVSK